MYEFLFYDFTIFSFVRAEENPKKISDIYIAEEINAPRHLLPGLTDKGGNLCQHRQRSAGTTSS